MNSERIIYEGVEGSTKARSANVWIRSGTSLLREARRQKGLATLEVPSVCILDADGDLVPRLRHTGRGIGQRIERFGIRSKTGLAITPSSTR